MAIASILALHAPQDQKELLAILGGCPDIVEMAPVDQDKIAAILDIPSQELTGCLKKISALPRVLDVELIFANYEYDLDEEGHMETPPEAKPQPKKYD